MHRHKAIFSIWRAVSASALFAAIASAQSAFAAPEAQPPGCRIEISVEPENADVLIDHAPATERQSYASLGAGRCELWLAPGAYVLELRAAGYDTLIERLAVGAGDSKIAFSRALAKTTGLALLKSEPPNAEITIAGISYGPAPLLVTDLPLGTWQATFSLPGFKETTIQFTMRDRTPVEAIARLSSSTATIDVSASVEGAEIKVNGLLRGVAPCTIDKIPAGDVIIEASAQGYRDYVQMMRVGEAEHIAVEVRMEPLPASISVYSLPDGARLYVNGEYKGVTPFSDETLEPGKYALRVEKDGFSPAERTVTLSRGGSSAEEFRLQSNSGKLGVTSIPDGVIVFVDGEKKGVTPPGDTKDLSALLEIDGIAEGKHSLKFVKPGFFEKNDECTILRGQTELKRVELKRRFIPDYEVITDTGPHRGVFVSESGAEIKIETHPGIISTYPIDKVLKHGKLK